VRASMDNVPVPVTPVPSGLFDSWIEGWEIAVRSVADYANAALTKGLGPFELTRWVGLIAERREPSWTTPHSIVFEAPIGRLRDFTRTEAKASAVTPTLVVPPQAGHASCIVDYSGEQSQMGAILASGLEHALALDWIGATSDTAGATIEDYLDVLDQAIDRVGGRVNLIGDCQGGWLATIYAALYPERVNTLTLAGAPIDFHAGEPVIHEVLRHLAPHGDLSLYEALVAADGGVLDGRHMLAGFILINPGDEISRQMELLAHLDDPAHVARYRQFEDWFKHTQNIPGAFYLWVVRHLFRDNELISGELRVRGQRVDLGNIDMPLNLMAGATDHITPPDQVFAIASLAGTPPDSIRHEVTPGGHLGLFMGHKALHEHWPPLLANVLRHSI
jgi:poly(3-hydroxybutyrate) depolymerase